MNTITLPGISLAVEDRGQGDPLLLIHGFPLDHTMWSKQIEYFAKTHRVIAPDLRGFGASTGTAGTVTMAQFAEDLVAMLNAMKITEPVVVCGLSMGGYVAWQLFDKFRDRVRALILCDTRAVADTPEAAKTREETAERVLKEGPDFLAESMIPKLFSPESVRKQPEVVEATRDTIRRGNVAGIAAASRGMARRPDVTGMLPNIDVPMLAIVGSDDKISTADEMRSFSRQIPNAKFVEVTGAGHMSPLEDPSTVNAAIDEFLNSLPA